MIGLILKTVHWTMFPSNAIGLEKIFLTEIVQSEKEIFFHFNFFYFSVYKRTNKATENISTSLNVF